MLNPVASGSANNYQKSYNNQPSYNPYLQPQFANGFYASGSNITANKGTVEPSAPPLAPPPYTAAAPFSNVYASDDATVYTAAHLSFPPVFSPALYSTNTCQMRQAFYPHGFSTAYPTYDSAFPSYANQQPFANTRSEVSLDFKSLAGIDQIINLCALICDKYSVGSQGFRDAYFSLKNTIGSINIAQYIDCKNFKWKNLASCNRSGCRDIVKNVGKLRKSLCNFKKDLAKVAQNDGDVDLLLSSYDREKHDNESFSDFVESVKKNYIRLTASYSNIHKN